MKLIYLLLLFPFLTQAQHTFKSESKELSWQHIYDSDITAETYYNNIKTQKEFVDCNFDGVILYGTTPFIDLIKDHSGMPIFARWDIQLTYKIEFKDNRYRVTVSNMLWDSYNFNDITPFEDLLLKKRDGSIRGANKYQEYLSVVEMKLITLFAYKDQAGW
jgi:hypothetical protein